VAQILEVMARKVVRADVKTFHLVHCVAVPEHIPNNQGMPVACLGPSECRRCQYLGIQYYRGPNKPRIEQNNTLLLVPETVFTRFTGDDNGEFFTIAAVCSKPQAKRKLSGICVSGHWNYSLLVESFLGQRYNRPS
jgi:hypothetical protein